MNRPDPDQPTCATGTDTVLYSARAVRELHAEFGDQLIGFVQRRLPGRLDPSAVVNEVWRGLLGRWHRHGALHRPEALLFQAAHLRCQDWSRTAKRAVLPVDWDRYVLERAARTIWSSIGLFRHGVIAVVDLQRALAARDFPARQRNALLFRFGYTHPGEPLETWVAGAALLSLEVHQYQRLVEHALRRLHRSVFDPAYEPTDPAPGGVES